MNVGVVGMGFAGAAAALELSRRGHKVRVYEAVKSPAPVGAGILLQPTGQAVLAKLGLLEEVRAKITPVTGLRCRERSLGAQPGRELFDLRYQEAGDAVGRSIEGFGLHRGVLFEALFGALQKSAAELRLGVRIVDVIDGVPVDDAGTRYEREDVVIVADGSRSLVRERRCDGVWDAPYPWGALWFVAEDPDRLFPDTLEQVVDGTQTMVGMLPTGRAPGSDVPLTSVFFSLRRAAVAKWRRRSFGLWKEELRRLVPRAEPLLRQVQCHDDVLFAAYRDVRLRRFREGRCFFIGDAAHALSPQLGQGSNLALLDAYALADAVDACDSVERMERGFVKERLRHIRHYEWANRAVTPFFQRDGKAFGMLRDVAFPIASSFPWVRRRMVQTMAGVERGVLRSPDWALLEANKTPRR